MKKISLNLFSLLVIFYLAVAFVFYAKLIWRVAQKPKLWKPSSIPALSVAELEKISQALEKRTTLAPLPKVDLTKFNFGKNEPFIK